MDNVQINKIQKCNIFVGKDDGETQAQMAG
jgi:hypothetical protein